MPMTYSYDFETIRPGCSRAIEFRADEGSKFVKVCLIGVNGERTRIEKVITSFKVDDFYINSYTELQYAVWRWNVKKQIEQQDDLYKMMSDAFGDNPEKESIIEDIIERANGREYKILCFLDEIEYIERDNLYKFWSEEFGDSFYVSQNGLITG